MMKRISILIVFIFLSLIFVQTSFSKESVKFYLFYSLETGGLKIEEDVIKPLSKKFPIEVQSFSVNQLDNYDLLLKFEKDLKDTDNELPAVIIGDKILGGENEIRRALEGLVRLYSEKGDSPWPTLRTVKMIFLD